MMDEPEKLEKSAATGRAPSPTARIDVVNKTLNAMYVHRPLPLTYREITQSADLHPTTVSLGLSTARDIGFTVLAGKKGLYNFTQPGEDYARNVNGKRFSEAKSILRITLLTNPLWKDVIAFLAANRENPRDPIDLTIEIERRLAKKWSQAMRKTVSDSLVSILEFGELVRIEAGKIVTTFQPDDNYTIDRFGPVSTTEPSPRTYPIRTSMAAGSDYYEFRDEGVYIKIRKDDRSIALAKDLVDLFARSHQSGQKTTKVEEAPGTSERDPVGQC